jgi:protein-S-isoprenylcysteine O-methyltransferase Ste14
MEHEMPDHADVKIHPPVLTGIHIIAAFLLKWFVIPLASPSALEWFGVGLVVIGFILAGLAFLRFRKARTTVLPHGSVSAIVSSGVFGFTRNPIYLGFLLMIIGFPLNFGTWWGLVLAPFFIHSANRLVIEHEEAYLEKKFGDEYTRYKRAVRRWL